MNDLDRSSMLLTDLYQLTMLQGYVDAGMDGEAVFEFFVRRLPTHRNFLIAAGLEQATDFLRNAAFTSDELDWLSRDGRFSTAFVDRLADFRFTGSIDAMPEGTAFFPNEPIFRVTAPLTQAQLVESRIINLLHFQTMIASKAIRMVIAAPGKLLVDFGFRRAHGAEAGFYAARAAYVAGLDGTATVLAGMKWGIPVFGTMAHAFVQAHETEEEAFLNFARSHPANAVLLIDTYDTERGAQKVVAVSRVLSTEGIRIKGVRLDSGDLDLHARNVRSILDEGGLRYVAIFASGNLDEYAIGRFSGQGTPIDGYGVGTRLDTSEDAPNLECAYKLQSYLGRPRRKRSERKETWPGSKQVFRSYDGGMAAGDTVALDNEPTPGKPLLQRIMQDGTVVAPGATLDEIRTRVRTEVAGLPEYVLSLDPSEPYPVNISEGLYALARAVDIGDRSGSGRE